MFRKRNLLTLLITHLSVGAVGFAIGIYTLPILVAPTSPTDEEVQLVSSEAIYMAEFVRNLEGSDRFHWGEGTVAISIQHIAFAGKLAPGPDYKLYLSPEFVETESEFEALKANMVLVGDVNTFDNFVVDIGSDINPSDHNTVVVWCETFGEFITAAKFK